MSNNVLCREQKMECFCQDESVFRTVSDMNNVNYGRKKLGCKGCNFFKFLGDEIVDERGLKIERQKTNISKFKNKVLHTGGWLKMSIVVGILSLEFNLVFVTMYFK